MPSPRSQSPVCGRFSPSSRQTPTGCQGNEQSAPESSLSSGLPDGVQAPTTPTLGLWSTVGRPEQRRFSVRWPATFTRRRAPISRVTPTQSAQPPNSAPIVPIPLTTRHRHQPRQTRQISELDTSGFAALRAITGTVLRRVSAFEPAPLPRCLHRTRVVPLSHPGDRLRRSQPVEHRHGRQGRSCTSDSPTARNLDPLTLTPRPGFPDRVACGNGTEGKSEVRPANPSTGPPCDGASQRQVQTPVRIFIDRRRESATPNSAAAGQFKPPRIDVEVPCHRHILDGIADPLICRRE
jgi:hypothetical protein